MMADSPIVRKLKKIDDDDLQVNIEQRSLEEASACQKDLSSVSKQMMARILTVMQEFMLVKRPLYTKRHIALKNIPHFWAIAFKNHPKLKILVNDSVEDCFNYLSHIIVTDNEDVRTGYNVVFTFDENPYFFNSELVKYNMFENRTFSSLKTNIDWKENMNLTPERPSTENKRGPVQNFFEWLQHASVNQNDMVCGIIKDDLWMDPLKYFLLPDDETSGSDSEEEEYEDIINSYEDNAEQVPHCSSTSRPGEIGKHGED